jgi:hypothetical protein
MKNLNNMDTQEKNIIVILGCIAFGIIVAFLYGMANELHDIRMELWNIKREHHVIVEHQYKTMADTIVVYKEKIVTKPKTLYINKRGR